MIDINKNLFDLNKISEFMPNIFYWLDLEYQFLGMNSLARKELLANENIIGRRLEDVYRKSTADYLIEKYKKVATTGVEQRFLIQLVAKSGKQLGIVNIIIAPLYDSEDKIIGTYSLFSKDQLLLEQISRLESNVFALDSIIKYAPDLIYWKDTKSVHLGCNDRFAWLAGLPSREDVIGKTDFDFPWKSEAESFQSDDADVIQNERPKLNIEDTLPTIFGNIILVISNKVPLRDKSGKVIGVLGVATEITKLKEAQEKLEVEKQKALVASNLKSEFIANMSHDIRTPISGVLAMSNKISETANDLKLIANQLSGDTKLAILKIADSIVTDSSMLFDATDELLSLCNDILDVVELDSGSKLYSKELIDLKQMLEHLCNLLLPVAAGKGLVFEYDLDENLPKFFIGFAVNLHRILLNLISNALKFTKAGFVKVVVEFANSQNLNFTLGDQVNVVFKVQDSGIGIDSDKLEVIFECFSRLNSAYDGVYKGSGLGLYTVKEYVEKMQGTIKVVSQVNQGSEFIINIPLTVTDGKYAPQLESLTEIKYSALKHNQSELQYDQKSVVTQEGQPNILIVEDNKAAAVGLEFALSKFKFNVDIASNATQVINMVGEKQYHLIFMDIGLPDFSGIEATAKIRAMQDIVQMPIIAITGHAGNKEQEKKCLAVGIQLVLNKPLKPSLLQGILDDYIINSDGISLHSHILAKLDVIDWQECLKLYQNNKDLTCKMLNIFVEDVQSKSLPILDLAYQSKDLKALKAEVHRLSGGACYLKLPAVEFCLTEFSQVIDCEAVSDEYRFKSMYFRLKRAIDDLIVMYESDFN